MSGDELSEWFAEYSLEPWGEFRADLAAGNVAAMVGNAIGGGKKGGGRFTPIDFVLKPPEPKRVRSDWREQMARLKGLALAMGGVVKNKSGEVIAGGRRRR